MNKEILQKLEADAERDVSMAKNLDVLEKIRVEYLGRKSLLSAGLRALKELSLEEKKDLGAFANSVRCKIETLIVDKEKELGKISIDEKDWLDVTAPGKKYSRGHINILSQTQREIEEIFSQMGFEIADGPDVEFEWYNFDALNMPKDHPARDMQDTFWIKQTVKTAKGEEKILPRTQTSNVQIRYMEKNQPPFRIIVPGRVFRNEALDATHGHTFYQFETLVVDKEITVANFKDLAQKFMSQFFKENVQIRLRPSYFPFVEPGFEFDISCTVCAGKGCSVCKQQGWIEIGGAGMVNQRVFEAVGYKRNQYQGFAWGFGIERLAMMKYKIDNIRLFLSGDLRFIRQF